MPIDYKNYPGWWKQFSLYIREERAGNRCERCKVPNRKYVDRGFIDVNGRPLLIWLDAETGEGGDVETGELYGQIRLEHFTLQDSSRKMTMIVLTVAHLDHKGGICDCKRRTGRKCAIPSHVEALCQRCHLQRDLPHHIAVRRKNLAKAKDAERGLLQEQI